jgi:hypothetical protein
MARRLTRNTVAQNRAVSAIADTMMVASES